MIEFENIIELAKKNVELHTVPISNKTYLWFLISYKKGSVYIDASRINCPKCKIKQQMKLNEKEFVIMRELYSRRCSGEQVSHDATKATRMQVYWYGIFAELMQY